MTQASTETAPHVPELTLGWRLRMARESAGIDVQQMAQLLSVGRSTISRWEHDGGSLRPIYLREWAAVCGVDYSWLVTGAEGKVEPPRLASPKRVRKQRRPPSTRENRSTIWYGACDTPAKRGETRKPVARRAA